MVETGVIKFERRVKGEEALVLQDGLDNLNDRRLLALLTETDNFPPILFAQLLTLDFTPTKGPWNERYPETGEKVEDLEIRMLETPNFGEIEVSEVILYPSAVPTDEQPDLGFHLKQKDVRGFEAILVLEGCATMSFPDAVVPVSPGVYARSMNRTDVLLETGDLVLAPAPVANGWTHVGDIFRFRYVGLPPWSSDINAKTY